MQYAACNLSMELNIYFFFFLFQELKIKKKCIFGLLMTSTPFRLMFEESNESGAVI